MKRQPSTSIPELPPSPRRKRALSEEERALWERVAKEIKPLRKKPRSGEVEAASAEAQPTAAAKPETPPKSLPPGKMPRATEPIVPPLASLGRRERAQLSRGRKQIDARLDLHGMTQRRAHRELFGFLQRAHRDGLAFVLVITGKGSAGVDPEHGVLRRQVPQWLSLPEFRSLVVGFEEAHIGHGGEGALYVRIRRSKL
jgi:DNA-nicking Smr family endonuclease